jgi:hypothetical protein
MIALTHIEALERLTAIYLESGVGGTGLVDSLGCINLQYGGRRDLWRLSDPAQPSPEDEAFVADTLLELFLHPRKHKPAAEMNVSILHGLSNNSRWRKCLHSEAGAYRLATLLVSFPHAHEQTMDNAGGLALCTATAPGVCTILNEWLGDRSTVGVHNFQPGEITGSSTAASLHVARAIFGSAWCDIALPTNEIAPWERSDVISAQRPPFLPGLLPARLEPVALLLPSMGAP